MFQRVSLFVVMTILIGFMDYLVNNNWQYISSLYYLAAQSFTSRESIFLSDSFLLSVYRYIISALTVCVFFLFCFTQKLKIASIWELLPKFFVVLLLVAIFVHMNLRSPNSDKIFYALVSFGSILAITFREHLILGVQFYVSRSSQEFWVISGVGLVVFVLSHELEFSYERMVATVFMINLWIYSTRVRNIWLAVVMHLAWNWVFPERADFHYFLFAVSFYLAFSPGNCPEQFSYIRRVFDGSRYLRAAWMPLGVLFKTIHNGIAFIDRQRNRFMRIRS